MPSGLRDVYTRSDTGCDGHGTTCSAPTAATSQMLPDPAERQAAQVCLLTVIRRTDFRSFISLDIKKILNAGTHLVF